MPETIILDPSEVATGRSELNINSGSIQVRAEGVDWGTAEIQAFMAESRRGESIVDYRVPNRQITIPLVMQTAGTATFTNARDQLSAKAAQIQAQGGWIKRVTSQGGTYFADLVNASLVSPGGWIQSHKDVENEAVLTLEALPDFYAAEATLSDHVETSACEITFTETTSAGGDFPLGDRVRVVVDEDDADNQRGLFWSFRSRHYSSASTAASAYEAEALTILDTATRVAKTGASNGSVVTHGTLLTNWTPVVGTNLTAGNYLTHTGSNRVYARVLSASGTLVAARLVYGVGDMLFPAENAPTRLYDGGTFQILDLGEVRLDPTPTGTHRWQGQLQAKGEVGGEAISFDRVWIVNQDESAGWLSLPPGGLTSEPTSFVGRDTFDQSAGALHAKTALVGGAWDTTETSSSANDFAVEATGHTATRSSVSDAAYHQGRYALLGSTVAACGVQVDFKRSVNAQNQWSGVVARYTDIDNWFGAWVITGGTPGYGAVQVGMRVTGTPSYPYLGVTSPYAGAVSVWYTLRLTVDASGAWVLTGWAGGVPGGVIASGQSSALATGGALDDGRVGFFDAQTSATANTRNYDNFITWSPTENAVMFASQSLELSTAGITREDSGGSVFVPITGVYGDLPRMPNRSSAGTVEFMAKASRGDLRTLSDPGIDDISARIYRRPSYLTPD